MRKINISITQAKLKSFSVEFDERPDSDMQMHVMAQLDLLTPGGEKVSTYTISTRDYYTNKFDLPINMYDPIFKIAVEIEKVVTQACNERCAMLPAPKPTEKDA